MKELRDVINERLAENGFSQFMEIHDDDSLTLRIPCNTPPKKEFQYKLGPKTHYCYLSSVITAYDIFEMQKIYNDTKGNLRRAIIELMHKSNIDFNKPIEFSIKYLSNADDQFILDYISFVCRENIEFSKCYNRTDDSKSEMERFYSTCLQEYLSVAMQNMINVTSSIMEIMRLWANREGLFDKSLSYMNWGKFGWTYIPFAPPNLFDNEPRDFYNANSIVKNICTNKNMYSLFDIINSMPVNKEDFGEAVFCYKNRKYKACSLLLFGIIDSFFIKAQGKRSLNKNKPRRKVSEKAIEEFKEPIKTLPESEHALFNNLFSCLKVMFSNANDFAKSPVINRHIVAHGMGAKVKKRDCIQLFLALYNLMEFAKKHKIYVLSEGK